VSETPIDGNMILFNVQLPGSGRRKKKRKGNEEEEEEEE